MHPRCSYVTNISYRVIEEDDDFKHLEGEGLTQNISYAGICLMIDKEIAPGCILELKFGLDEDNSKVFVAPAKIVWQKKTESGFLTGLKFYFD